MRHALTILLIAPLLLLASLPASADTRAVDEGGEARQTEAASSEHADHRSETPSIAEHPLVMLVHDGILQLLLGSLLLLVLVRRGLRKAPPLVRWGLFATVVAGTLLRVFIAEPTTMTAWGFSRTPPIASSIFQGPLLAALSRHMDAPILLADVIAWSSLLLAALTPLVVFAHARYLFKDDRTALLSAVVMAVLPMHIRFSASDVYFVQSIACSSMTFALIYTATRESSRGLRILATLALPGLAYTTILVRPLNVGFFPLFVFTAIWLVGRRAPLVRKLVIVGLLSVAAGAAFWQFMGGPGGGITEELFVGMFENSGAALFDLKFNTLLNPVITPTGFLLLATAGAVIPFVHKEGRLRALFLLVWLVAFFVTHAIIMPRQPEMQARYHLHLAVPFALLVAWGARRFLARGRIAGALLALYALAIPFVHLGFETDVAFDQMREYDFLATLPEQLPRDCTVIEFTGSMIATESSRTRRHAEAVHKGERTRLYKTYEVGRLGERVDYDDLFGPLGKASPAAVNRGAEMASITRADIQRLFDEETPECIYLYEGLRCWSEKAPTEAQAPSCDVLRDMLVLEKVAEERFPPRIYDSNFALGYGEDLDNPPFDELGVALYKVRRIREPLSTPRRTDERSPETTPEAL